MVLFEKVLSFDSPLLSKGNCRVLLTSHLERRSDFLQTSCVFHFPRRFLSTFIPSSCCLLDPARLFFLSFLSCLSACARGRWRGGEEINSCLHAPLLFPEISCRKGISAKSNFATGHLNPTFFSFFFIPPPPPPLADKLGGGGGLYWKHCPSVCLSVRDLSGRYLLNRSIF